MKNVARILLTNLAILAIYTMLIAAGTIKETEGLGYGLLMMLAVGVHVFVNFGISMGHFNSKEKEKGKAWLLATFMVLIVGFATCTGLPGMIHG
jgi:hypothetical protein